MIRKASIPLFCLGLGTGLGALGIDRAPCKKGDEKEKSCEEPVILDSPDFVKETELKKHSITERKIESVKLRLQTRHVVIFEAKIDGEPRLMIFHFLLYNSTRRAQYQEVSDILSASPSKVKSFGFVPEPIEEVLNAMGLEKSDLYRQLQQARSPVEITELVSGRDFQDDTPRTLGRVGPKQYRAGSVYEQLEAFRQFCTERKILIRRPFLYYVTDDSQLKILDVTAYESADGMNALAGENQSRVQHALLYWNRLKISAD